MKKEKQNFGLEMGIVQHFHSSGVDTKYKTIKNSPSSWEKENKTYKKSDKLPFTLIK